MRRNVVAVSPRPWVDSRRLLTSEDFHPDWIFNYDMYAHAPYIVLIEQPPSAYEEPEEEPGYYESLMTEEWANWLASGNVMEAYEGAQTEAEALGELHKASRRFSKVYLFDNTASRERTFGANTMRQRRRRIASQSFGDYFEQRLRMDFGDIASRTGEGTVPERDIQELYDLPLDSHVGRGCKDRVDEATPLVKELIREDNSHYAEMVAMGVMSLAFVYYFG